jgi:predicted transporter
MFKSNRKSFYAKKIGLFFLVALVVLISRLVYWDIPVEELKSEYANEQSEFMELNGLWFIIGTKARVCPLCWFTEPPLPCIPGMIGPIA